jgi:hypothetical protein
MNQYKKILTVALTSPIIVGLISSLMFKEIEISIVLSAITAIIMTIVIINNKKDKELNNILYIEHIRQIQKFMHKQNKQFIPTSLPISIIIGPSKSGKSGFLKENNINMLNKDEIPDIDIGTWWQNKQELFLEIDTDSEFNNHQENSNFWNNLISAIQTKSFIRCNLKNIIITIPITNIHTSNNHNSNKIINNIQEILKSAQELAPNTKINIVFNQCDKILGFQSFFYDLNKDERNNLLAIFKNSTNYNSSLAAICKKNFPQMIASMQQHVLKRLRQEHDPLRKFEIKDFPLQMEQLIEPTISLIKQLEIIMPKKIYGIYFCCNNISNNIVDFIHSDCGPKITSTQISIIGNNEKIHGYFNSNIITQINCLKVKIKYTKKDIATIAMMSTFCISSLFFCYNIYANYTITSSITKQVSELIKSTPEDNSYSELDKLYLALEYMNKTKYNNNTNELRSELQKQYDSFLTTEIQNNIAQYLGNIIKNKVADNKIFYPEFARFQAMSGRKLTTSEQLFLTNAISNNNMHKLIKKHMQNFANNHNFNLKLDKETNEIVEEKLGKMSDGEKTILLITSKSKVDDIFTPNYLSDKLQTNLTYYCNQVTQQNENKTQKCIEEAKNIYINKYSYIWQNKAKINITEDEKLDSIPELLSYLEKFNSENDAIIENINTANEALKLINKKTNNDWLDILSNKNIIAIIGDIQRLCHDNKSQAFYEEIFNQENNPQKSILSRAQTINNNLGEQQQLWFSKITESFDKIANKEAYNYLNEIWQNTVIAYYNKKISSRFPISQTSSSNIEISDFEQFFSPSGILKTYIKLVEPVRNSKAISQNMKTENYKAFISLNKIIQNWFDKYNKPRLSMTLIPMELERNAKNFILEIGNKKIEMNKNNEKTNELIWPETGDNLVTVEFENVLGQSSIKNKNNPWSLLQLL